MNLPEEDKIHAGKRSFMVEKGSMKRTLYRKQWKLELEKSFKGKTT